MAKRKLCILSISFIIVFFIGLSFYKHKTKEPETDCTDKFYTSIKETFFSLFETEVYEYINNNYIKQPSDISSSITLDKFSIIPEFEGLTLTTRMQKSSSFSNFFSDIRINYKGIQLISGRLQNQNNLLTVYSPSLYDKAISADTEFIKNNIGLVYSNNVAYQLISEFAQMYPEEFETISNNVLVTYNNGYDFTIQADAFKILLELLKDYIFNGQTSTQLISNFVTAEYYANPNNAEFYTLDEYKELYIDSITPTINNIFFIAIDLINFDITLHFDTDSKGNIKSITYKGGNESINSEINISFTPYKNTYNLKGSISLQFADNVINIDMYQNNSADSDQLNTVSTINLTYNNNQLFTFLFESHFNQSTQTQELSFDFTSEHFSALLLGEISYFPFKGELQSIKEDNCNITSMNIMELSKLAKEINNNIIKIKERLQ